MNLGDDFNTTFEEDEDLMGEDEQEIPQVRTVRQDKRVLTQNSEIKRQREDSNALNNMSEQRRVYEQPNDARKRQERGMQGQQSGMQGQQSGMQGQQHNQKPINQTLSRAEEKINGITEKAAEKTKEYSNKIKHEYNADMSNDMKSKGAFGWSLYLYAIMAFGFFMFESSTALLLLAAWVIVMEHNQKVNKMIISTLLLYIGLKIGWSIFLSSYSLIYDLMPSRLFVIDLGMIKTMLSEAKRFISNLYDFVFIVVGLRGLLLAKKGGYYKIKFVEELFD